MIQISEIILGGKFKSDSSPASGGGSRLGGGLGTLGDGGVERLHRVQEALGRLAPNMIHVSESIPGGNF